MTGPHIGARSRTAGGPGPRTLGPPRPDAATVCRHIVARSTRATRGPGPRTADTLTEVPR